VFAWGINNFGQLGNGNNNEKSNIPLEIERLRGMNITHIACGNNHNIALTGNQKTSLFF
jgi:alpha-tubulin suppressor-like RCC1 family protein